MNRIYSIVFNRALGQAQVASELARHRGAPARGGRRALRRAMLASALALLATGGAAAQVAPGQLPTGGAILGGGGSIDWSPGELTVTQTGDRALIRWDTFDIGSEAGVTFEQGAGQIALNQILDVNPSQIFGELTASGTVFLVNPNGIVFGDGATLNVGSLVASTLVPLDPDAFLEMVDGEYANSTFAWGGGTGAIIANHGTINAPGGSVVLLGAGALNAGNIDVGSGHAALLAAGGAQVALEPGGTTNIIATGTVSALPGASPGITNTGTIRAAGGSIELRGALADGLMPTVVNNSGLLVADALGSAPDGSVMLVAHGGSLAIGGSVHTGDTGHAELVSGSNVLLSGNLGAGSLAITATGAVQQTGGTLEVSGSTALSSSQASLTGADNDFVGAVSASGGMVTLRDANALTLGSVDTATLTAVSTGALNLGTGTIRGNLNATSHGGAITQSGALGVDGTSMLDAGSGAITLNNAGNDFAGAVSAHGGAVALRDANTLALGTVGAAALTVVSTGALDLGAGTIGGNLGATSHGGPITQSGALGVGGTSTLDAGSGAITLTDAGNNFTGAVSAHGGAVALRDVNTLALGTVDATGLVATAATITLGGNIATADDQTYDGAVALGDDARLTAGGDVDFTSTLDGAHALVVGADGRVGFGGAVGATTALSGLDIDAGSFDAGSTMTVAGDLGIAVRTGGIAQSGAFSVGGQSSLDAASGAINLTNADNDFVGAVSASGGAVTLRDANALRLGTVDATTLTAASTGALDLGAGTISGNLDAASHGGAITQSGALDVGGTSTLDAGLGTITLANAGNDFSGAVSASGGAVTLRDANALTLGTVDAATLTAASTGALDLGTGTIRGNLSATSSGGAITQSGTLDVGGTSTLDAGLGAVTLVNAGNDFAGAVSASGGAVALQDANALTLGTVDAGTLTATSQGALSLGTGTIRGNLSATSGGGAITQSGALEVGGASTLDAGSGAITLIDAGNDFTGAVSASGGTVTLRDANALTLGSVDAATLTAASTGALDLGTGTIRGNLSATSSGGAITQSGALDVGGTSTLNAGLGAITLANAGNDFVGAVNISGNTVAISDGNALTLGTVDAGALTATSQGALDLGNGTIGGNLGATSHGGAITQSGALDVDGTSTLDAGSGAITLTDAGNDFTGAVSAHGGAVALRDVNTLALGTVDAGTLTATSQGALSLGTGTIRGNLSATSGGGAITQSGALGVGGTSTLDAGSGAIALTDAGNDFAGEVTLTGGAVAIRDMNGLSLGTVSATSVQAAAAADLTLNGQVWATGDIALSAGSRFINQAGAQALQSSGGRWLVYLGNPGAGHQYGGLDSANLPIWNTTAFSPVAWTGSRYVFAHQPLLAFTSLDADKVYGQLAQLTGYTVSGLMPGAMGAYLAATPADILTGTPLLTSAGAAAGATVAGGPYAIDITTGTLATSHGYGLAFDGTGLLTVTPAGLIITASDADKVYGQLAQLTGYTVQGLVNGDRVGSVGLASAGSATTANVGRYTISVDGADGVGLDNYDITYVDGTLTVGRAGLVITASDADKIYGQLAQLTGYTVEGLVNGDRVGSVGLTSAGSATTANVGRYTISVDGADGVGLDNYDITYVDGTLTVGRAGLVITASDVGKPFGEDITLDGYTVEGLLNGDRVNEVSLSSEGAAWPALPGRYAIVAADAVGTGLGNYKIEYVEGALTVGAGDGSQATGIAQAVVASLVQARNEEDAVRRAETSTDDLYRIEGTGIHPVETDPAAICPSSSPATYCPQGTSG